MQVSHSARRRRTIGDVVLAVLPGMALLAAGCSSTPALMPTPNAYRQGRWGTFAQVPPALQTNTVDLLYVTDRSPEIDEKGRLTYGYRRSPSLAFGACHIGIGDRVPWETLREESLRGKRSTRLPLLSLGVRELGRFPPTPMDVATNQGALTLAPAVLNDYLAVRSQLHREIQQRLEWTPRKDVYVFVHGFNNDFRWVTALSAQLWHFLEREGVFISYTWPAGRGGLRGYTYDRESGEFTVLHLKTFLRTLLDCPGIERIHLLAHSRGTDVLTTALRELVIERRGPGLNPVHLDRVANVILMAPDLDVEVAGQRLSGEHLQLAVGRLTVYVCREDKAITFANWFFEGVRRLGILQVSDVTERGLAAIHQYRNVQFVDARVKAGFLSHGYFYNNPAVSSDLVLLLRNNCDPGTTGCRPLQHEAANFWRLTESYPALPSP